jgi:hypothetical protein
MGACLVFTGTPKSPCAKYPVHLKRIPQRIVVMLVTDPPYECVYGGLDVCEQALQKVSAR